MDDEAIVNSLRSETARIRNLSAECRQAGIFLEDLPEEIQTIRDLVHGRRMDAALDRMRVFKLELLARLLLQGSDEAPPAPIENAPAVLLPSDSAMSATDAPGVANRPASGRSKPPLGSSQIRARARSRAH